MLLDGNFGGVPAFRPMPMAPAEEDVAFLRSVRGMVPRMSREQLEAFALQSTELAAVTQKAAIRHLVDELAAATMSAKGEPQTLPPVTEEHLRWAREVMQDLSIPDHQT